MSFYCMAYYKYSEENVSSRFLVNFNLPSAARHISPNGRQSPNRETNASESVKIVLHFGDNCEKQSG